MTFPQFAYWFSGDDVLPRNDSDAVSSRGQDVLHLVPGEPAEAVSPADVVEAELVARIGTRDQSALQTLYERIYAPLWDFARTVSASRDAADDLVQEAFALLWERAPTWDARSHVRGFLYTTVRLLARNSARRLNVASRNTNAYQADVNQSVMSVVPATPAERLEHRELVEAVARAVAALPEPRRTALILRWRDELPYEEIARVLGISTTAAQHLVVRARAAVRQIIAPLLRA